MKKDIYTKMQSSYPEMDVDYRIAQGIENNGCLLAYKNDKVVGAIFLREIVEMAIKMTAQRERRKTKMRKVWIPNPTAEEIVEMTK